MDDMPDQYADERIKLRQLIWGRGSSHQADPLSLQTMPRAVGQLFAAVAVGRFGLVLKA